MKSRLSRDDYCMVFDLDDTLYKEADYRVSGILAVCKQLESIYPEFVLSHSLMQKIFESPTPLDQIILEYSLSSQTKESLKWIYRLHHPKIELSEGVAAFFQYLQQNNCCYCILTDGRSVTQRLKLEALGLRHVKVFVSEELGSTKDHEAGFVAVENFYETKNYLYVGDNPKKDFLIPNQRNWLTFGVIANEQNIHDQNCSNMPKYCAPKHWIKAVSDLRNFIC